MGTKVLIYYTNDLHNRKGALQYLKSLNLAEEDPLLLDAGDAIGGSNTVFLWDEPILRLMSELGYKAMALGNREWNYLRRVVKMRSQLVNFPFLAANVQDPRGFETYWQPYHILNYRGIEVGILGLSPVQYKVGSWLEKLFKVRFLSPQEALAYYLPELQGKAELLICLSHLGLKIDKELAAHFPQIHLWLGGHSHIALAEAVKVDSSYIMQAGYWGRWVGKIELEWEDNKIKLFNYQLLKTYE
jgi:2',3'-cyclic-nucleotide 2'-phosphodiesterase (5'-nucleotidase family)